MTKPTVSTLIVTYNAEEYIEKTINSVLDQSYEEMEILIVDNNSRDQTKKILQKYRKKDDRIKLFFKQNNLGAYPGLNFLISKSSGKYIAILDHDDLWHKKKIETQVNLLEKKPEFIGCGTGRIYYYEKYSEGIKTFRKTKDTITFHTTLMFKNQKYRYDTSIEIHTDIHFMKNILCKNEKRIYNIQQILNLHRVRNDNNNLSSTWRKQFSMKENNLKELIYCSLNYLVSPKIFDWVSLKIINHRKIINLKQIIKLGFNP